MVDIPFTVDSALLNELGARLVGQPHIALAELIKNSYDADARHVRLTFDKDKLIVEDDGHGMSFNDFVNRWMRIGTTHKQHGAVSPELNRTLTGSKGVGRLATQLLAGKMRIESVGLLDQTLHPFEARSNADPDDLALQVEADVDWTVADKKTELTQITVPVSESDQRTTFVDDSACGTRLTLHNLVADWDADDFRALAQEIWVLQPPFTVSPDFATSFKVTLVSPYGDVMEQFGEQMSALLENWQAFISFELLPDDDDTSPSFVFDPLAVADVVADEEDPETSDDRKPSVEPDDVEPAEPDSDEPDVPVPSKLLRIKINLGKRGSTRRLIRIPNCLVDEFNGEIRVFNLSNRQPNNIRVADARRYMSQFGGVHLYDSEFRLPYYGPEDWLNIERDSARRISRSELLPGSLSDPLAMQDLPSRRRLFGVARISTAHEGRAAQNRNVPAYQTLAIQSSRDRLVDNKSLKTLKGCVRLALDLYATDMHRAKSLANVDPSAHVDPPTGRLDDAIEIVKKVKPKLEEKEYEALVDYLDDAKRNAKVLEQRTKSQSSLLGSLATIGMTTLAWDHESTKQRLLVMDAADRLSRAAKRGPGDDLVKVVETEVQTLRSSASTLDQVANLFRPVLSYESRSTAIELKARKLLAGLARQIAPLARGAIVTYDAVPPDFRLASGTHAGWSALFQNLLLNAFAAVLETPRREVVISASQDRRKARVIIQDTGTGVDLAKAESYFDPFERGTDADDSEDRMRLGLGGTGLGLTIVRVIASDLGVKVRFVEPEATFSTAVMIEWEI